MGLLRTGDGPQGPDPHLDLKILLFFIAAALAVAGMLTESPWTIYAAILVILAGLLLRFLPSAKGDGPDSGGE